MYLICYTYKRTSLEDDMKKTTDLLNELCKSAHIDNYLKSNEDAIIDQSLSKYLCQIFDERSISKSDVIKNSDLNEIYAYQILAGKRAPSRDKVICICIGARFSVEDTNQALRIAKYSPLYPKFGRDSIIIFGIHNGYSILEINKELYSHQHETL